MNQYAEILVHHEYNPLTMTSYPASVEWIGDPSLPVRIPKILKSKQYFALLPFELEQIDISDDWMLESEFYTYARKDRHFSLAYHRFMADWLRLLKVWRFIKHRIILTFIVWGIGYASPGEIITWNCLLQKKS